MKKLIILSFLMLSASLTFSQAKTDNWPELKSFHSVMAQTFHPSEEGDLKPIKERAGEMVTKAEALQKSKIPADLNNDKIKSAIDRLVTGSKELKTMVDEKESDEAITKNLSALHDTFHEIVGLCQKDDGHGHGDGHGHSPKDGHQH